MDEFKKTGNKAVASKGIFSTKNFIPQLDKLFDSRNKLIAAIILIIGIILMTVPGMGNKSVQSKSGSEEEQLCVILSKIQGCGKVSAMITYTEPGKYNDDEIRVKGAVIVAEGAGSIDVRNKLSEATQAALDLPAHKVRVYKSE